VFAKVEIFSALILCLAAILKENRKRQRCKKKEKKEPSRTKEKKKETKKAKEEEKIQKCWHHFVVLL